MIKDLLRETGALMEGHFLLSSGKHSDGYVQCAKLLMHPDKAEKAVEIIAEKIKDLDFDLVVGPAMGGILVSYEISRQTGKPGVFVERENGEMTLRRGFNIEKGQRVIIAEDVVTTGKSSHEAIKVVEAHGGKVIAIACIVDRSKEDIGYPIYSAVELDLQVYEGEDCPMCKEGKEIIKPGSRKL